MKRRLPKRLHLKHGAYYYVCRVRVEGSNESKVKWTLLSKEYSEALKKWAELEGGKAKVSWTVSDAIAEYLRTSERRLRPATMTGYREAGKRLIAVFGAMPIEDLTKASVYTYVVRRGNYAGNREKGLLSAVYAHLSRIGVFNGSNPAAGMRYRNPEKPRKRYVTDAEFAALLEAASPRMRTMYSFAYLTGMRQADIIGLKLTAATEEGIVYTVQKTGDAHLIAWTRRVRQVSGVLVGATQRAYLCTSLPLAGDRDMAVVQLTLTDVGNGDVKADLRLLDGDREYAQTSAQILMESVMEHIGSIAHEEHRTRQQVN